MPLQKILFKPGVNRENTRYTTEGGWYDSEKVRFRQGTPEVIGGWNQTSSFTYQGVCRSLWSWATLDSIKLTGVGTNLKFYIDQGGYYNDITPIRSYVTLNGPFAATPGSTTITVTDTSHGAATGDFVSFVGAESLSTQTFTRDNATEFTLSSALANNTAVTLSVSAGGALPTGLVAGVVYYVQVVSGTTISFANVVDGAVITTSGAGSGTFSLSLTTGITADVLDESFRVTVVDANTYTIESPTPATAYDVGDGGTAVYTAYEIPVGYEVAQPLTGWGAGGWGTGSWGIGTPSTVNLRLWSQNNFGQDLIYNYRGGAIYYWNAALGAIPAQFTVTIATPGVVTYTGGELSDGMAVILQTTGALPTGLSVGTVYYIKNVSGATFNLATTPAGTEIDTTGTQSGTHSISVRGLSLSDLAYASDVPSAANYVLISDASRFVLAFGTVPYLGTELDPMVVRWSAQESAANWTPAITNQAGELRLSHGSQILTALQTRQEIVVFTDTSLYSLQYLGPPYVWGSQLLADNVSMSGVNTAVVASGVIYWMGADKFYKYDGRVQTLRCDLRQYIFQDINLAQQDQFFCSTNEGFNEIWWFYCSSGSDTVDKYAVYNYAEDIWYYGLMARTAWLDSGINDYPLAATYIENLVYHEYGVDDNATGTPAAIEAYISSSEFDIGDGHNFGFVWRLVPDITFRGSTATNPSATMTLLPLQNSGSGINNPASEGGVDFGVVTQTVRGTQATVEQFTQYVYIRVRGRQMSFKVGSNQLGTTWQLGAPRMDIRPDGRR